jgi:hypothetical protein
MRRQHWQGGTVPSTKVPRSKLERLSTEKVSREAEHEDSRKIEKGTPDLRREVDAQDFVFAAMEAALRFGMEVEWRRCIHGRNSGGVHRQVQKIFQANGLQKTKEK